MTFSAEQKAALSAKLDMAHVKSRDQGNGSVQYIEGWHAIDEANRIFGFDGWHRETVMLEETNRDLVTLKPRNGSEYQQWRIGYIARVRITVGGVVREGTGYGSGMGKPEAIGDAVEGAIKEAETDAMKRALMTFGNPFGLALYDKGRANVTDTAADDRAHKAEQLRDDLVRQINDCANPDELAYLAGDIGFKDAVGDLPDNNQREVRSAYKVKATALQNGIGGDVSVRDAAE